MFAGIFLLTCVYSDILYRKIPNRYILFGYLFSLSISVYDAGWGSIPGKILFAFLTILILYPLFLLKVIGAGDVKVFSVLSVCFLQKEMIQIVGMSFLIGAMASLIQMILSKQFLWRMIRIRDHVTYCMRFQKFIPYKTIEHKSSYLCFTICILISFMLDKIMEVIH